ncbi:RUN domain-containing protein 1 [Glossina fuscipes fuscipes]
MNSMNCEQMDIKLKEKCEIGEISNDYFLEDQKNSNNAIKSIITTVTDVYDVDNNNQQLEELIRENDNCKMETGVKDCAIIIDAKSADSSSEKQQLLASNADTSALFDGQNDFDEGLQPLSERWSPLGANYDDAVSPSSELLSPESELDLLSHSDNQDKLDYENTELVTDITRLKTLEEEQEFLTTSLMALTSHFAHVQLRVQQIVEAPSQERDQLLKDLEEFAFRGIPEASAAITTAPKRCSSALSSNSDIKHGDDDVALHQRQFELIHHLKSQLIELEKLAYESGAPVLPQHMILEKQKIIIDELKQKLNFKVDEYKLPELTAEELKSHVDTAIGEFVGPLKMKEQLVAQLKTQITDLERFIAFLQCDTDEGKLKAFNTGEKMTEAYNSYAAKKKHIQKAANTVEHDIDDVGRSFDGKTEKMIASAPTSEAVRARESLHSKAHGLMDKASLLMQMFASTHFGSKPEHFQKNILKKTDKGNHWGDLRAQLEVDIQEVASLAATLSFDREKLAKMHKAMKKSKIVTKRNHTYNGILTTAPIAASKKQLKPYRLSSDSDEDECDSYDMSQIHNRRLAQCARFRGDSITTLSKELTTAVRKNFAMTLLKLIQHGLRIQTESVASSLIVPFMRCLNPSPEYVAEHNYRARDFDAASFTASPFGNEETENADNTSSNAGFFNSANSRPMHAWELILEYYYIKNGDDYNNTPARKLSQSFNLEIVDSQAVTAKQTLLSAVGAIIAMHRPYKRSYNAHFKAFICAGLNSHQLVDWLNLIFSCSDLIETYYLSTSYVSRTGFRDALRSIETLYKYDFKLPVDLAVRHFRNL